MVIEFSHSNHQMMSAAQIVYSAWGVSPEINSFHQSGGKKAVVTLELQMEISPF